MKKQMRETTPFDRYVDHMQDRLAEMQQRTAELPEGQAALTTEALEEISNMLEHLNVAGEELVVTEEELRQRNQELVSARKAMEAERRRYRALFEFAPDGYLVTDPNGLIEEANQAAAGMLNVESHYLKGRPLAVYVATAEREQFRIHVNQLAAGEEARVENWGLRLESRGKDARYVTVNVSPIRDGDGEVTGLRWMIRDVTAQRENEAERERLAQQVAQDRESIQELAVHLAQERDALRTIMENTHAHLAYLDPEFNFVRVNATYAKSTGHAPEELIGRNHFELFPDSGNERVFQEVVESGEAAKFYARPFEYTDQPERGTTYWDWRLAPVKDRRGEVRGLVLSLLDVTSHERTRRALGRYAQRLQALHEADQEILSARSIWQVAQAVLPYVLDLIPCQHASVALFEPEEDRVSLVASNTPEGGKLRTGWRGRFSRISGQARESLTQGEIYISENEPSSESTMSLVKALHREGFAVAVHVPLIIQDKLIGSLNLGMKDAEELTIEHMEIAREISAQLAIGIRQMHLNEQVRQHARTLERLVARRTASLQASEARFRAVFEQSAVGIVLVNPKGYPIATNTKFQEMLGYDEEELHEISFPQVTHPADVEKDQMLFEELIDGHRSSYTTEKRYIRKNGETFWSRLTVSSVYGAQGELRFIIAVIEDISDEKMRQEALIQAEKLTTAGKLAASLAHEINNPLQSVIGCLGLAEEVMDADADSTRFVEIALEELRRAARIVARLRDVHRSPDPGSREPTDLTVLMDQVLTLTHKECENHDIAIHWTRREELPTLHTASDRIKQVFLNLVLNAVDAMPAGGDLYIEASTTEKPAGVRVTLRDTGPGIAPDVLPRIFDTFYTTKEQGMGLGLFISRDIVNHHGGTLEARSELGRGAEFEVWLPLKHVPA